MFKCKSFSYLVFQNHLTEVMTPPWKFTLYLNSGTLFCPGPPISLDPPFQASLLVTYQYSGIKILKRHSTLSLVLFSSIFTPQMTSL